MKSFEKAVRTRVTPLAMGSRQRRPPFLWHDAPQVPFLHRGGRPCCVARVTPLSAWKTSMCSSYCTSSRCSWTTAMSGQAWHNKTSQLCSEWSLDRSPCHYQQPNTTKKQKHSFLESKAVNAGHPVDDLAEEKKEQTRRVARL